MVQLKAHNLYELILFKLSYELVLLFIYSLVMPVLLVLESCMYVYNIRAHTSYDSYVTENNIILSTILALEYNIYGGPINIILCTYVLESMNHMTVCTRILRSHAYYSYAYAYYAY
mgnify:CR=1 FL=1